MDRLKTDCRLFRSDRPCAPHKATGVTCATCTDDYDPIRTRLLVVKLAAVGDVLRTTSLLPAIHRRWPAAHVTWVTAPGALPLFAGNRLVDRVLGSAGTVPLELLAERFDVVLCPDAAADAVALAHLARLNAGGARIGFDLDARGVVVPLGEGARTWYELGLSDEKKRANRRLYQEHVAEVLGLDWRRERPMLALDEGDRARGAELLARHPPRAGQRIVGLNTGAGGRWRWKRWTESGWDELTRRLAREGCQVWLLGGPEERQRNARLRALGGDAVLDTGCDNTLRAFAGIVERCDVVVTGDTLALHVAVATGRRVVALFGPTSLAEIDLADRGERLAGDVPCLCCYRSDCDVSPSCMETLAVDTVHAAVQRQLEACAP